MKYIAKDFISIDRVRKKLLQYAQFGECAFGGDIVYAYFHDIIINSDQSLLEPAIKLKMQPFISDMMFELKPVQLQFKRQWVRSYIHMVCIIYFVLVILHHATKNIHFFTLPTMRAGSRGLDIVEQFFQPIRL